jgi:hypothetical protein
MYFIASPVDKGGEALVREMWLCPPASDRTMDLSAKSLRQFAYTSQPGTEL